MALRNKKQQLALPMEVADSPVSYPHLVTPVSQAARFRLPTLPKYTGCFEQMRLLRLIRSQWIDDRIEIDLGIYHLYLDLYDLEVGDVHYRLTLKPDELIGIRPFGSYSIKEQVMKDLSAYLHGLGVTRDMCHLVRMGGFYGSAYKLNMRVHYLWDKPYASRRAKGQ